MTIMETGAGSHPDDSDSLDRARKRGGIFRVPPADRVTLSGPDAFRYLNGQITRDLSRIAAGEASLACILTPKGRLCAELRVSRSAIQGKLPERERGAGGDYPVEMLAECDPSVTADLIARLERYIVADDVTLSAAPAPGRLHLFGEAMERMPAIASGGIRTNRLGVPGVDLEAESLAPVEIARAGGLLPEDLVEILRIERRIPLWGRELDGEILPPEAGLDLTHIDYDRGCYPGQETISRLKSIGRVNRLLRVIRAESPLHPGMIIAPAANPASEAGRITSAARLPGGETSVALAFVARTAEGPFEAFPPESHPGSDPLTAKGAPISIDPV